MRLMILYFNIILSTRRSELSLSRSCQFAFNPKLVSAPDCRFSELADKSKSIWTCLK